VRRYPWLALSLAGLVGALLLSLFPARAYLDQRRQRDSLAAQVAALAEGNAALDARVAQLQTDAEIERLARERYLLVRPGEEAYTILPTPPPPPPAPAPEPEQDGSWWSRAWSRLSSLL
jgi:cell division protein FtsB